MKRWELKRHGNSLGRVSVAPQDKERGAGGERGGEKNIPARFLYLLEALHHLYYTHANPASALIRVPLCTMQASHATVGRARNEVKKGKV